jgi:uncharacterized repeat protein (TIGR02543 family)
VDSAFCKGSYSKVLAAGEDCRIEVIVYTKNSSKYTYSKTVTVPKPTHNLTVTSAPGGHVILSSPRGEYEVSAGKTGTGPVVEGTEVTLKANPVYGYEFSGWSGDASGTAKTTTVYVDRDKSVTAHFKEISTPSIPIMTWQPDIDPEEVTSGGKVTVSVSVTTNTDQVAIRLFNPDGSLAVMAYKDNPNGEAVVTIQTPMVRSDAEQVYLEVWVLAKDKSISSYYSRNLAKSGQVYTVHQEDGKGNVYDSVTDIPISWLTISH